MSNRYPDWGIPDEANRGPSSLQEFLTAPRRRPEIQGAINVVCIGDSITEGFYATTLAGRWVEQLAVKLAAAYDGTAVPVYYPAHTSQTNYTWPWTLAGGSNNTTYGLGRRAYNVGSGATMSISFSGDSFRLFYAKTGSGGVFSYAVDGGAAVQVDTSGSEAGGLAVTVTGLAAGTHTVAIARVSGTSVVEGLIGYTGTTGIRVYDSGHSGYEAADFVDGSNPHWIDAIATIQPALVIIMLGVNDTQSVSAADFQTNVETLIANVRAQTTFPPSIALVATYKHGSPLGYPEDEWADYTAALDTIAAADDEVLVVDLEPAFGGFGAVTTELGLMHPDRVHPINAGHQRIAETIVGVLTSRTPREVQEFAASALPPPFVGCIATKATDQSVTDITLTDVLWPSTDSKDTHNFHFTSDANLTGTVSKTAGSKTITGSGTSFTTELTVNQVITIPGTAAEVGVVRAIASNTSLTLWQTMANSASGQTATRRSSYIAIPAGLGGMYEFSLYVIWDTNNTGTRFLQLTPSSGGNVAQAHAAATGALYTNQATTFQPIELAEGAYVKLIAYANSGGTRTITGTAATCRFAARLVGT